MNAKKMLRQLVPSPRRPITWTAALPLAVFLLLYGALCAWLELSGKVLFANWAGFLLLLAAPWVWWMHVAGQGGLTRLRGTLALLVRLSLVGLFAMLMAEPRAVRSSDKISRLKVLSYCDHRLWRSNNKERLARAEECSQPSQSHRRIYEKARFATV